MSSLSPYLFLEGGCGWLGWEVSTFPVAHSEVENLSVAGIPECLSCTGGTSSAPAIESDFAAFGKSVNVLLHLIHRDMNGARDCAGLLNFLWSAYVDDYQC